MQQQGRQQCVKKVYAIKCFTSCNFVAFFPFVTAVCHLCTSVLSWVIAERSVERDRPIRQMVKWLMFLRWHVLVTIQGALTSLCKMPGREVAGSRSPAKKAHFLPAAQRHGLAKVRVNHNCICLGPFTPIFPL